jgi:hypothetical protein
LGESPKRAVEIGRSREDNYLNAEGKRVAVKLGEIETLDMLASEDLDGLETYSEPVPAGPEDRKLTVNSKFHPEVSKPTQTGVS